MSAADASTSEVTPAAGTRSGAGSNAVQGRAGPGMAIKCVNLGVFQGAWFACVLGADRGWWWVAPAAALVAMAIHLALANSRRAELLVLLVVASLGTATDMALVAKGVVGMRHEAFAMTPTVFWFASLWVAFATTLNSSMSWLTRLRRRRNLVAAVFGAIGGPLAYLAGQRLGAITLTRESSFVVLALEWAVLTPLAVTIAARLSTERSAPSEAMVRAGINGQLPGVPR